MSNRTEEQYCKHDTRIAKPFYNAILITDNDQHNSHKFHITKHSKISKQERLAAVK